MASPPKQTPPAAPTAEELEKLRSVVQQNLNRDPDERFAREVAEEQHDTYDMNMAHGGTGRSYTSGEWDRAMGPTDPARRRRVRDAFRDSVLPDLPVRPGWKRIWISTTHPFDTPQKRVALGYSFVTAKQLKEENWAADHFSVKDASSVYEGCIMWREMIAMEIDVELRHDYMREHHHDAPNDQARSIYENLEAIGDNWRAQGGRAAMSQGMESLRHVMRPPKQFEG